MTKIRGKEFFEQEFYKILCIIIGGTALSLIAIFLGNTIYSLVGYSSNITNQEVVERGQLLFSFNSWMFIASANFFVNIFKYILRLRKTSKLVDKSKSDRDKSDAELASLASRVNPHFLYNSLNSIASLAKVDASKTEDMTIALADFYRYSTNRKDEFDIPLSEELEIVKTYLKIEQIRFGDRLKVIINVEEKCNSVLVPRFSLQPIVENAIKYGFNDNTNSIDVKIEAYIDDNTLNLRVYDGGKPFEDGLTAGYGINSIKKKLELRYPSKSELSFNNEPRKFVAIEIILT